MALKWLREHQKRVLVPLSVVIIIAFVFLFGAGGGRGGGDRGGEVVAEVGGRKITRGEYSQYMRILSELGYRPSTFAPYYYLIRAEAARKAGVRIGIEQLRDRIRTIVKAVFLPGKFTDARYRRALEQRGIRPSTFEEFIKVTLLGEVMSGAVASTSLVTEDEYYLAHCRQRERLTLRQRDFVVSAFEKDVEKPTDEDVRAYYDEHEDLDPELSAALATEPEVAVEYAFVEKKLAGRIARVLREDAPLTRPEGLLAGPLGSAVGGLTARAMAAAREGEIRKRYEDQKDRRYRLPDEPQEPKKKEGEGVAEAEDGRDEREGEEEPGKESKEKPEPRYRPLDEVRDEIAKEIDSRLEGAAARRAAERFLELARAPSHFRAFEADSMLAGLGLAGLVGALAGSGVRDRVEFMSVCEEAGAAHGVTGLLGEKGLERIGPLGRAAGISASAISKANSGTGDRLSSPTSVSNGCAVWRVADHHAPRTLTFEEAKDEARRRIVHARAEKKAREAASDFVTALVEGTAELSTMKEKHPMPIAIPRVGPFAMLGLGEIPEEPVAFKKDGTIPLTRAPGRDEELAVMETARYRVAIVVDRDTPTRQRFEEDKIWRTRQGGMLPLVRWTFMQEHWRDESLDKVESHFYRKVR